MPGRAGPGRGEPGRALERPEPGSRALRLRTVAVDGAAARGGVGRTPARRTREKRLRLAAVTSQSA